MQSPRALGPSLLAPMPSPTSTPLEAPPLKSPLVSDSKAEPSTSSSAPDDPIDALCATLQENLHKALEDRGLDSAVLAKALADCVIPPVLDLHKAMDYAEFMPQLPIPAWVALNELARARSSDGLTRVALPLDNLPDAVADGLASLDRLETLDIVAPSDESLDLSALRCARLHEILLRNHDGAALEVTAPAGVRVRSDHTTASIYKSSVRFVDPKGQPVGKALPLDGLIYHRAPTDFKGSRRIAAETMVVGVRLNGQASFSSEAARSVGLEDDRQIVCRHLAVHWIVSRIKHLEDRRLPTDGTGPLSSKDLKSSWRYTYADMKSPSSIAGTVQTSTETLWSQLEDQPPFAIFEADRFGTLLAHEMKRMQSAGVDRRWFCVRTQGHALAFELALKPRLNGDKTLESDLVVNLYDPNLTATHRRLMDSDTAHLESRALSHWIGQAAQKEYFPSGDMPPIGVAFAWPPRVTDDKRPAPLLMLSAEAMTCPAFLELATESQSLPTIKTALTALPHDAFKRLASPPHPSWFDEQIEQDNPAAVTAFTVTSLSRTDLTAEERISLIAPEWDQAGTYPTPLGVAMACGHAAVVTALVRAVLVPDNGLNSDARAHILLGADAESTALHRGMEAGHAEAVRAYVDEICKAPATVLTATDKAALLAGAHLHIAEEEPAAFRIAESRSSQRPRRMRQYEALFQWAQGVASRADLALATRATVCAAVDDSGASAASMAIQRGNPQAAAAIVCGLLSAGLSQQDARILLDKQPSVHRELLPALSSSTDSGEPWAGRLVAAIPSAPSVDKRDPEPPKPDPDTKRNPPPVSKTPDL